MDVRLPFLILPLYLCVVSLLFVCAGLMLGDEVVSTVQVLLNVCVCNERTSLIVAHLSAYSLENDRFQFAL